MELIEEYKQEFINILKQLTREDSDVDGLIEYLERKGFFTAPFSSRYHNSYSGGLCKHCIDVYKALERLVNAYLPETPKDTVIILGLLFNIYKMDMYEKVAANTKQYSSTGSKSDSIGNFDWVATLTYKVKDSDDRITFGSCGFNSYMIISRFIALSVEESVELVNGHCGMDDGYSNKDLYAILAKFPLTTLLHSANLICTYLPEGNLNETN